MLDREGLALHTLASRRSCRVAVSMLLTGAVMLSTYEDSIGLTYLVERPTNVTAPANGSPSYT